MRHNPGRGIMGQLMRQGAVISCGHVKGANRRHVDAVSLDPGFTGKPSRRIATASAGVG